MEPKNGKTEKMKWRAHAVGNIPNGYQVAVADVDKDGRPDILALSSEENIVEWYENPSWKRHPITTETTKNISFAPLFKAGYPARGLALASDFDLDRSDQGGSVWWAEPGASLGEEWPLRLVGRIPTSHRLRWADIDGDGREELLDVPILGPGAESPDYAVGAPITWFEMPAKDFGDHASGEQHSNDWIPHLIDDSLTVVHGVLVMDWNGDRRQEILTASFEGVHLFESRRDGGSLRWTKRRLASGDQSSRPHRGSSEIGVGKLRGRRFLATIEPWHGNQVVVYTEPRQSAVNTPWDRHVIDGSFNNGHALVCADLDGDGNDEIVAGYRGPGTSLYIYSAADSSALGWERQTLDSQMAASCVAIHDLNGDGRLDIVSIGSSTGNVTWYENLG